MTFENEVLLVLGEDLLEQLEKQADENFTTFSSKYAWRQLMNRCSRVKNEETKNCLLYWNSLNWNLENPTIELIDEFLSNIDKQKYLLVRVGESPSAFIECGYLDDPYFDIRLVHHLEFNRHSTETHIKRNFEKITELVKNDIFQMEFDQNKKALENSLT